MNNKIKLGLAVVGIFLISLVFINCSNTKKTETPEATAQTASANVTATASAEIK